MKKLMVFGLSVALILTAAIALILFWQTQIGTIDYWLANTLEYRMTDGQWETVNFTNNATSPGTAIPIYCRNDGFSTASFDLIISFTNAVYGGSSDTPRTTIMWGKINDTAARYSFTVNPHQTQSINVSFTIDSNTEDFVVSLSFESTQFLFVESARKGSLPWEVVYRSLCYFQIDNSTYVPALIS